jgi:hypothetical protein
MLGDAFKTLAADEKREARRVKNSAPAFAWERQHYGYILNEARPPGNCARIIDRLIKSSRSTLHLGEHLGNTRW